MKAKFKAIDIADFYIQLANSIPDDTIDNLKINKLLYYAQGTSLAVLGRPIFGDSICAWDYGPVIPDVYYTFRCCGRNIIEEPREEFDESRLSSEELDLLIDVYLKYGKYTGLTLKNMSHNYGSPWQQVYKKGANAVIPDNLIKDYFISNEDIDIFESVINKIPTITKCPSSWDSPEDSVYD